jgi:CRISPR-associated protein Cmr1
MIDNLQRAVAMKMIERRYTVRFLTPAFLGDAEQKGRWRTPPFKAQLRQWWRVAYAASHGFRVRVADMRREEGLLFGNAWLADEFAKSKVRLRLDRWDDGKLNANQWQKEWGKDKPETAKGWKVFHPDVGKQVGPNLYLGYGPLEVERVQLPTGPSDYATALKKGAAIQAAESAMLAVALPDTDAALVEYALWLMDRYGTVGGRSRNGSGSYRLTPMDETPALSGEVPLRNWRSCLELDWPHAIGKDKEGALIWQTAPHGDWKALMRTLAIVKIGLRTQFKLTLNVQVGDRQLMKAGQPAGIEHAQPQNRHWLAYPVTRHEVRPWEYELVNNRRQNLNLRLPNQLRFKVRRTDAGQLVGVIFHMPHLPPEAFRPNRTAIEAVWACVHDFLDALCEPANQRRYEPGKDLCAKADREALAKQKAQLDKVQLQRIEE